MRLLILTLLFVATTINDLLAWLAVHKLMGNLEPLTIQAAAA